MHTRSRHLVAIVTLLVLVLALLLAVGEPHAVDLVVSDATFPISGDAVPVYPPTDPCRDFVQLHGTLAVFTKVSLNSTTRGIRDIWLYVSTAKVIGAGTNRTYYALGAVATSEICAATDPCHVEFRTDFQLFPAGSCPMTMVRVTGGLFFRPDGALADGSRPGDPTCTLNDPVGVTCSGFRFVPVPYLLADGWGGLRRARRLPLVARVNAAVGKGLTHRPYVHRRS